jgi:hypothetical protein
MRKLALFITLAVAFVALPLAADPGRGQSYFTYDDGGTIVRQGDDGRDAEARVNMPVFPGDEVITNRGRAEIRLSDGNVIGLDRGTTIRFHSILDSYDGDASQTVIELRSGHAIVHRTDAGADYVRIDTDSASYVASQQSSIYSIEVDRGKDRVTVFDGMVEVRTPSRRSQLRAGEEGSVDDRGLYGLVSDQRLSPDDFEKWFIRRAERYDRGTSRYLDRSLSYADYDLDQNGSWIYVSSFGWAWRPHASQGWRPYVSGYWHSSPSGCLVWVSYEPWGWVPYHYGRWAYDPGYGWFWLPGSGYAPAWVYWAYGPSYVGWAPAGWWDCYKPYYNWCYRPYQRAGLDFGFGFFGRVRANDLDLRPWTFVDSNTLLSNRSDRAALTTDAIRNRLARDNGGFATVSSSPARFTRNELRDPTLAVNNIVRRGIGSGTGNEGSGSSADLAPFFRRDPDLSNQIRDRVVRTRPSEGGSRAAVGGGGGSVGGGVSIGGGSPAVVSRGWSGGGVAPIGGGSVAPIGGGNVAPIGGGSIAPIGGRDISGRVGRGEQPAGPGSGSVAPPADRGSVRRDPSETPTTPAPSWRDRNDRPGRRPANPDTPVASPAERPRDDGSWRVRTVRGGDTPPPPASAPAPAAPAPAAAPAPPDRSDVPRRVIDRIGGARVYTDNGSRPPRESGPPPAPRPERAAPPPPPPQHDAPPPPPPAKHNDDGGRVHRDHHE